MQDMPKPAELEHPAYAPLVRLLNDQLMTPKEVAAQLRCTANYLANLRRQQRGFPYVRLPFGPKGKGAIRYRQSDIVGAMILGTSGPVSLERVNLAIAGMLFLPLADRELVMLRLKEALR